MTTFDKKYKMDSNGEPKDILEDKVRSKRLQKLREIALKDKERDL